MNIASIIAALPRALRRHCLVKLWLAMSPDAALQRVSFNQGAQLMADLKDANARQYWLSGSFEPEFFDLAKPFLRGGGVFFDVGANFGFCTFGLMSILQNQDVEYHMFEANPELIPLLRQSASLHTGSKISINYGCVSQGAGYSKLAVVDGSTAKSYVCPQGAVEVPNLILDDYISNLTIKSVDFMKMDIEGHEPAALGGANKSLREGVIRALYIEISPANLSRAGYSVDDCFGLLKDCGFRLFYCKPADFKAGIAKEELAYEINGCRISLAELTYFPADHQSDILAVHKGSGLIK